MSSNKRFKFLTTRFGEGGDSDPEEEPNSDLIIKFYDPETKAEDAHGRTLDDILEWGDAKLERCHNYIQMLFPLPEGSPFNWEAPVIDRAVMEAFLERDELRSNLRRSFERMLSFYGFEVVGDSRDEEMAEPDADPKVEGENSAKGKQKAEEVDIGEGEQKDSDQNAENKPVQGSSEPASVTESTAISQDAKKPVGTETSFKPAEGMQESDPTSSVAAGSSAPAEEEPKSKTQASPKSYQIDLAPHYRQAFRNWAVRFDHNHLRITRILRCLRVLGLQEECEAFYAMLKYIFNHPSIRINERSMTYWQRAARQPLHVAPDGERIVWLKKWEMEQEEKTEGVEQS